MRVQRREATDVLSRDGVTAVLIDGQVLRLGALGSAIWARTVQPVEVTLLARQLESELGSPADRPALDATKDAVADLIHHGVLIART